MSNNKLSFIEKNNISPVVFSSLSLLLIFFSYQIAGSLVVFFLFGDNLKQLDPNSLRLASSLGQVFFMLLPTILLSKLVPDTFKDSFKLNPISLKLAFFVILSVLAIMEIAQIVVLLQAQIPFPEGIREIMNNLKKAIEETYRILVKANTFNELFIVTIVIAIIPAISEELLFRGIVQTNFIKGLGAKSGIIITGLLFALFHFNPFSFFGLLIIGIYFSFLVYKTNSIYTSIIGHFTNNFIAIMSFYFLGKEDIILKDSNEIILSSEIPSIFLIFTLCITIFIFSLYNIYKIIGLENK